ncbi:MAG: FAD-binding oxidoreductase, partial [Myxococcales bacterium]|nr:FAD-binding oxidoreductase [Myxococcales bacterium]
GVSIRELIETFLPRGFFPAVVPGTWHVTVGGAIANDIHGKNHHVDGSFCDHVRRMQILTASGDIIACDREATPDLFWATVGGLGLTGIILSAEMQLTRVESELVEMASIRFEDLDGFFEVSRESASATHVVGWLDSVASGPALGRGILMRGRHAPAGREASPDPLGRLTDALEPVLAVPFDLPDWLMNRVTMRLFNEAYFRKHPRGRREVVVPYGPYFFPLDFVRDWNRGYGKRGMLQYQLSVPPAAAHDALRAVLNEITHSGMPSFLTVIKEFGDRSHGGLSFPTPGALLALDFPNFGAPLLALLERLDALVADAGGRVYLGKDARLPRDVFRRMYPEWERWKAVRDHWDPDHVFQSALGRRLGLSGE